VNQVGPDLLDQLATSAELRRQAPRTSHREIEIGSHNRDARFAVSGCETLRVGWQRNNNIQAQ
jgi:hypothetical protein